MLQALLEVPRDREAWDRYSFHNRFEIDRINAAILAQHQVNLPSYPLDPIDVNNPDNWLEYNSQSHIAFNGVLGLQSNDLQSVNINDEHQLVAWIYLNWKELSDAEASLKI